MNERRLARYLAKIDHATKRLALVDEWLPGASKNLQVELATYHAFQEAAEAAADLAAMAVVDSGQPSRDDRANFAFLAELRIVPEAWIAGLQESTSLRNRLVHEYDGVTAAVALASIARLRPVLGAFFQEVTRWISTRP